MVSGWRESCPANPVARIFKGTADDSPSPWGEGRDEGGREPFEIRMPQGQRVAPARPVKYGGDNGKPWRGALFHRARRTKLGDDGNQMQADGNSFPEFSLGWTIGANLPLAEIPFPATIAL